MVSVPAGVGAQLVENPALTALTRQLSSGSRSSRSLPCARPTSTPSLGLLRSADGTPYARIFSEATNHHFARISDESTRSEGSGIIECMFEQESHPEPDPEVVARFDELFERRHPSTTAESAALIEQIGASVRAENRAAAAQLTAIGKLFAHRLSRCSETEDWAADTMTAVAAEVAAALRISQGLAESRLHYARVLRERLPQVGAVFAAGDIDYRTFQTIVYRTDLITDERHPGRRGRPGGGQRDPLAVADQRPAGRAGGQDRGPRRHRRAAPAPAAAGRAGGLDRGPRRRACPRSAATCSAPTPKPWTTG